MTIFLAEVRNSRLDADPSATATATYTNSFVIGEVKATDTRNPRALAISVNIPSQLTRVEWTYAAQDLAGTRKLN
jgi:hypothetical protein